MQTAFFPAASHSTLLLLRSPVLKCVVLCALSAFAPTAWIALCSATCLFFFSNSYVLCELSLLQVGRDPLPLGLHSRSLLSLLFTYFVSPPYDTRSGPHVSLSLEASSSEKVATHNSVFKNFILKSIYKKSTRGVTIYPHGFSQTQHTCGTHTEVEKQHNQLPRTPAGAPSTHYPLQDNHHLGFYCH